jgi:uncharacterized membrane protein
MQLQRARDNSGLCKSSIYAILSALAAAVPPVVTREAARNVRPEICTLIWSVITLISAVVYLTGTGRLTQVRDCGRCWRAVTWIGLLSAGAGITFAIAIRIGDPALVSCFGGLSSTLAVILGVLFLRERLGIVGILGASATTVGALVITYNAERLLVLAAIFGTASTLFSALSAVLVKTAVQQLPPVVLTAASRGVTCLAIAPCALILGVPELPSLTDVAMLACGAFFGPFLAWVFLCQAIALGEAWIAFAIRTSFPAFVVLYSLFLFHVIPSTRQMLGGVLTTAGVAVTLAGGAEHQSTGEGRPT